MSKDYGGPAFPTEVKNHGAENVRGFHGEELRPGSTSNYSGMTLRDYFAAKAMQASRSRESAYLSWDDLAKDAYEIADAMLAKRAK